ncbi:oligosaccharide flippase family protein [Thermodesulfobacteriota bacterium]
MDRYMDAVRSKTALQTITLFSSIIFGIPLGIVSSAITTRVLGAEAYGILSFFTTITVFCLLFFRFGFSESGGLLVARTRDEGEERELVGATILIFTIIGFLYSAFLFCFSFFVDDIFDTSIGSLLRWMSLLLFFQPFQYPILSLARGGNHIGVLSIYKILPRLFYIVIILLLLTRWELDVTAVILLTVLTSLAVTASVLRALKPSFRNLGVKIRAIRQMNREYGINLYKAQIVSMASIRLSGLFIGYFADMTSLGFFSLATVMATPLVAFSTALSTSLFKRFTSTSRLSNNIIGINAIVIALTSLLLWFGGKFFVLVLFTAEYIEVAALLKFLIISSIFEGLKQPYNVFLGANGHAVWLRKIATSVALTYLVANIILVPSWGAYGAAAAGICGQFTAFAGHVWFYRRHQLGDKEETQ